MGDSFTAFEKRYSCVRKLKAPIVSENDSENKIKHTKSRNSRLTFELKTPVCKFFVIPKRSLFRN